MKKTILVVCLATAYLFSNAQSPAFGVKAGLNIATLNSSDNTDFKSKVGFHVGGLAHIHLSRYFAVQPEVVYSEQGAKVTSGNTEFKYKFNYINIPVLLQYMAGNGFRLQTGPQLGLLTSAHTEAGNVSVNNKSDINTADFSWAFGAGYLSHSKIGVDARYNVGISD
ncbi:MAG: porin family protein, partial [Ferruginibacter sp.]